MRHGIGRTGAWIVRSCINITERQHICASGLRFSAKETDTEVTPLAESLADSRTLSKSLINMVVKDETEPPTPAFSEPK